MRVVGGFPRLIFLLVGTGGAGCRREEIRALTGGQGCLQRAEGQGAIGDDFGRAQRRAGRHGSSFPDSARARLPSRVGDDARVKRVPKRSRGAQRYDIPVTIVAAERWARPKLKSVRLAASRSREDRANASGPPFHANNCPGQVKCDRERVASTSSLVPRTLVA